MVVSSVAAGWGLGSERYLGERIWDLDVVLDMVVFSLVQGRRGGVPIKKMKSNIIPLFWFVRSMGAEPLMPANQRGTSRS